MKDFKLEGSMTGRFPPKPQPSLVIRKRVVIVADPVEPVAGDPFHEKDGSRLWLIAAFAAFILLVVGFMAWNFRLQPAPPVTVTVASLECVGMESGFLEQEGWKRVHAADENRVIGLTINGKAEWQWVKTEECREAGNITRRFLVNKMWWRTKK